MKKHGRFIIYAAPAYTALIYTALIYTALIMALACGGTQSAGPGQGELENQVAGGDSVAEGKAKTEPSRPAAVHKLAPIPDAPQPAPQALLATAAMDKAGVQMVSMGKFFDAVQPGMGEAFNHEFLDQMVGNLVGLERVSGLDYAKPLRAVILDPRQADLPVVMVAAVSDEKTLYGALPASGEVLAQVHKGYAAIGTPQALEMAAPYALTTLAAEPAPSMPTMTVEITQLIKSYDNEIGMVTGMLESQAASDPDMANAKLMFDKLLSVMRDSERMQVMLDMSGSVATARLVTYPRAGTAFATLAGQQKPAEFSLAASVPSGSFFIAGELSETMREVMDALNRSSLVGLYGEDAAAKLAAATRAWYEVMGGEFAMSGSISQRAMKMNGVWTITNAKKAEAAMKKVLAATPGKATTKEGAELAIKTKARALRYKGVTAAGMDMTGKFDNVPADQRQAMEAIFGKGISVLMAVVSKDQSAFAMGPTKEATDQMRAFIDMARGKKQPALNPAIAALVSDAKKRGESVIFAFDFASFMAGFGLGQAPAGGDWITFGLGFPKNTMEMRLTVPASTIRTMIMMGNAGP